MSITIRKVEVRDEARWRALWDGYIRFYEAEIPESITGHTWKRLMSADVPVYGIVAEDAHDGVIGMAKTWARELGRKGIRSNAVCPGFISTPIISTVPEKVIQALEERVPMGRLGKPEEIANTFAFLASDDASYINGAVIEVSGGLTI